MGRVATELDLDEDGVNGIPLTLGDSNADDPNLDLIDGDDDDIDPAILALQSEMETLVTSQKEEREFLQNTILEMSQRPAPLAVVPATPTEPLSNALDFKDLPDPVENREDFNRVLGERVSKFVNEHTAATTAAITSQSQTQAGLTDLENRFTRDHKDLAGKPGLFQAIVTQEVNKIKNRGLNPQQFIFADPDKFVSTVAKTMRDELGIEEGDGDEEDEAKLKTSGRKTSRTQGVKGASMPKLKKGGKDASKKPLSLVKEIKKQQHAMGLI